MDHNRTQNYLQYFFLNILQKYYQIPILGTLNISGHFHKKTIMQTCRNFNCEVKILKTCYSDYSENAWSCPPIMIVLTCRKHWYPKCWNQLVENFYIHLHAKNQLHFELFFRDFAKALQACHFGNFGNAWRSHQNHSINL